MFFKVRFLEERNMLFEVRLLVKKNLLEGRLLARNLEGSLIKELVVRGQVAI